MEKTAIVQKMNEAITAGDAEQFQAAFVELCDKIQESVIEQARGIVEEADQRILSERGVRQLTSKEKEYYQKLAEAMKSTNPKQAVENLDVVMPYTVIDKVFEDLKTRSSAVVQNPVYIRNRVDTNDDEYEWISESSNGENSRQYHQGADIRI